MAHHNKHCTRNVDKKKLRIHARILYIIRWIDRDGGNCVLTVYTAYFDIITKAIILILFIQVIISHYDLHLHRHNDYLSRPENSKYHNFAINFV